MRGFAGGAARRRGMALWVVLILAMFLFLMVANLTMLSHGEMNQLARTESWIRVDVATRSVYEQLVADLRTGPWEKRPFRGGPVSRTDAEMDGVRYSALLEDTKGADRAADIWICAEREGVKRVVFHRILVRDSVFQKMNRIDCVFFGRFNPDEFGSAGSVPSLRDRVDAILERRAAKEEETRTLASRVQNEGDFGRIMSELGLPVTGAQPLTVQSPFSPEAKAGYARNPALLSLAGLDLSEALGRGGLSIDSFKVVQGGATRDAFDPAVLRKLTERTGERAAGSILDKVTRLTLDPAADPGLLSAGLAGPEDEPFADPLAGLLAALPRDEPSPAASADGEDGEPAATTDPAEGAEPAGSEPTPEPATPDPVDPSDPPPADAPADPAPAPDPAAEPAAPGATVYTFDDLVGKKDLYDDDFVQKWDGKKGLIGARRSFAAYAHVKESKFALQKLMNEGKAEVRDFERFIRSQNTLARYSIVGSYQDNYERERQKVVKVAREYFKARAGAAIGPDGAPKL